MITFSFGLLSYILQILQNVTEGGETICQLSQPAFASVCEEVLKNSNFKEFALKPGNDPEVCEIRHLSSDSGSETEEGEELRVRLCSTKPELFLVDGDEQFSVNAYQFIAGRFVRIRGFRNLKTLGFEEEKDEEIEAKDADERGEEEESKESKEENAFTLFS